jgi:hypothetical protein
MMFFAAMAHLVLLVGCAAAFRRLRPGKSEWRQFVAGGIVVLAYFAAIVAFFVRVKNLHRFTMVSPHCFGCGSRCGSSEAAVNRSLLVVVKAEMNPSKLHP